ncbi:Abi family protein [Paraburkholderia bonniea]|uniref:Abi family protein n=1 Tax=Paraburkholderia bonniea TaxID=2152891 RepID=UPI002574862D|nr:Abi family protein [Paraburkholderia bonniea]WJF90253.1 Abi family protein [Paraburkholderia bonniea]WJF93568.1 Abi family protein [Paraburkholderia bonniea]
MHPTDPDNFEYVVAKPRLDSYRSYFKVATTEEAIALYMWNCEISSCFSTLLSYFEITLRNNIHRGMSLHYSDPHSVFEGKYWWDRIESELGRKTMESVNKIRLKNSVPLKPVPSADEIVSRVSFGFWSSVLGHINAAHATAIFPVIFPHHHLNENTNQWRDATTRKNAISFIYEINQFRNRLAHHEPLWKFGRIMDMSIKPAIMKMPESSNFLDSIERFLRILNLFDGAMRAMNLTLYNDLLNSSWRNKLNQLLSFRGLERYRTGKYYCINDSVKTPDQLSMEFSGILANNRPVRIADAVGAGVFVPD